jgi:hypothetical protein
MLGAWAQVDEPSWDLSWNPNGCWEHGWMGAVYAGSFWAQVDGPSWDLSGWVAAGWMLGADAGSFWAQVDEPSWDPNGC